VAVHARESDRQEQITLTLNLGSCLDHFTRKPLLRRSLHLMRGPARWAGLSEIQQFLELGFDTFQAMGGARDFIAIVGSFVEFTVIFQAVAKFSLPQ
jgi:hypothetical protein